MKSGEIRRYTYYRCSKYTAPNHPKTRLTEREIDRQILEQFQKVKVGDEDLRQWFIEVIRAKTKGEQVSAKEQITELRRFQNSIHEKQDRLVNLRMADEIDKELFERKNRELRGQERDVSLRFAFVEQNWREDSDLAIKSLELSQNLIEQ